MQRLKATFNVCKYSPRTIFVMTVGLMFIGCTVSSMELALIPTPSFLVSLAPLDHEGMALFLWCSVFFVFGLFAAFVTDAFGHKRVYAYGSIMALFACGLSILAVGLHPNPTASPFFWISTAIAALAVATVTTSSYTAVSAFSAGSTRRFSLGLAVSAYSTGTAIGSLMHAPIIKDEIAATLTDAIPVLAHAKTAVAIGIGACAALFVLFTIPLVRKHPRLSQARAGFVNAFQPLKDLAYWRLALFCVSWLGAKMSVAYSFYVVPAYLERNAMLPTNTSLVGYTAAITYGGVAIMTPLLQIATTMINPLMAIAIGAGLSALAPWWLMWSGIGLWSLLPSGLMVVFGESILWVRLLSYAADVVSKPVNVGMYVALALGMEGLSRGLVAVIGPLVLNAFCPSHGVAECQPVALWGVLAAITSGWSLLALPILKISRDPGIKDAWKNEVDFDNYAEMDDFEDDGDDDDSDSHHDAMNPFDTAYAEDEDVRSIRLSDSG